MIVYFPNHGKSYKISQDNLKISQTSCMRTGLALIHTHHLYALCKLHIEYYLNSRGRWMSKRWKCSYYLDLKMGGKWGESNRLSEQNPPQNFKSFLVIYKKGEIYIEKNN